MIKTAQPALPKGGGAVTGIGETFQPSAFSGTAHLAIPLHTSPCRGFEPQLSLEYGSASGNGVFGMGFHLAIPNISRKTTTAIPKYDDTDSFLISNVDDLVPVRGSERGENIEAVDYVISRYRPRIEGLFARIEKWVRSADGDVHWRVTTKDSVTSFYGQRHETRIADPADETRVFQWLIERSCDAKGNQIVYEYRTELANRHFSRIKYGNYRPTTTPDASTQWHFEVAFEYSEPPESKDIDPDRARPDPLSSYRSGFRIRTAVRCLRISMSHRFERMEDGAFPALENGKLIETCATRFDYCHSEAAPALTLLKAVIPVSYRGDAAKTMPPLEFTWSQFALDRTPVAASPAFPVFKPLKLEDGRGIPDFLNKGSHQMVDLYGEGLPGILYSDADTVRYSRPAGGGSYAAATAAHTFPIDRDLQGGDCILLDLAGNGKLDLVVTTAHRAGYYESTRDGNWEPYRSFASIPTDLRHPQRQMVDVSGDGLSDLLLFDDGAVTVYPSKGKLGYDRSQRRRATARLPVTASPSAREAIRFADFFGDGGQHLARIRNGSVECWPNLGYGRFGPKVELANAPRFVGEMDASRLFLADIDGSGTADLVYAYRDHIEIFRNESGCRFSEAMSVPLPRPWSDIAQIGFADVLGNGTACLVFTSLNDDLSICHQYCDFTGGIKPYLLTGIDNNMGASTFIHYKPSTQFYLADERAGTPWVTRLPFPVQVVEKIETIDHIGGSRLVARYSYHHGHFDPIDREFRGFGRVDRLDAETFDVRAHPGQAHHVPPVLTKTWYHTGACDDFSVVSQHHAAEYYSGDALAKPLADSVLDPEFRIAAADNIHEACRALQGHVLREEVYGQDHKRALEMHPYLVTESTFYVGLLQQRVGREAAVCVVHPRERISYHYERNPADPRIAHTLTLQVDDFGNVLKEARIGYGRRQPDKDLSVTDQAGQSRLLVTFTQSDVTNAIDDKDNYHAPLPAETRTFELTGCTPENSAERFSFDEWARHDFALLSQAQEIPYEQTADDSKAQRRLIEQLRTLYRPDDLGASERNDPLALLPLGALQGQALPGETYKLAFTPGLLAQVFQRSGQALLGSAVDVLAVDGPGLPGASRGGYVNLDGRWWAPSGRVFLSARSGDTALEELAHARAHFFLPHRTRDPFHTMAVSSESFVTYDAYDLLVLETRDALGNRVVAQCDYRVLLPWQLTDPNGNRTRVAFDIAGRVVATAVMGKSSEDLGDSLEGFDTDPSLAVLQTFIADPQAKAASLLGNASTRIVYDLDRYQRTRHSGLAGQPPFAATLARETHASDALPPHGLRIHVSFAYADGLGRALQTKTQAAPGDAPQRAEPMLLNGGDIGPGALTPAQGATDPGASQRPRWIGSGRTVYNNMGMPVRQYEPFFSTTHLYEPEREMTDAGVSSTLLHDPLGRVVATLHPNQTWDKLVFDPWRQASWDVNDTVLSNPKNDPDVGKLFQRLLAGEDGPTWYEQRCAGALGAHERAAADKAAGHANTPSLSHFDALGRPMLTVADNGEAGKYETRVRLNIAGQPLELIDANGRIAMRYDYDLLGHRIKEVSIDAGTHWTLHDASGSALLQWDSQDRRFRTAYDPLRRPVATFMQEGEGPELCLGQTVYGEGRSAPEAGNLRGRAVQVFDQAGVLTEDAFDFKGNLLRSQRQLAAEFSTLLDWTAAAPPLLEEPVYASQTAYDALNRPRQLTAPDNSVISYRYDLAGELESVRARLRGAREARTFVRHIRYNARGQRVAVEHGNGVQTRCQYDPLTSRLVRMHSLRGRAALQDLRYVHDAAGNITQVSDQAHAAVYFKGQVVDATSDYDYDAVYRLVGATGREHRGQQVELQSTWNDEFRSHLPQPGDGQAMRRYTERYRYDAAGNIEQTVHRADGGHWTREFEHAPQSNRLLGTKVGEGAESFTCDAHGNMLGMPHLQRMSWDCTNQLRATARQVVRGGEPQTTWYVYDATGQRVRQVTVASAAAGRGAVRQKERIYLGGFEIYREFKADGLACKLERETLHVMDDRQLVALIETRTLESGFLNRLRKFFLGPRVLIRYPLGNHLGSASLELDDRARIISYEEFSPYGATTYQATATHTDAPKRYRYSGKERDDATGLYYYGARYYAPWLSQWINPDPAGTADGLNLYAFVGGNPIGYIDHQGLGKNKVEPASTTSQAPDAPIEPGRIRRWKNSIDAWRQRRKQLALAEKGIKARRNEVAPEAEQDAAASSTLAYALEAASMLPTPLAPVASLGAAGARGMQAAALAESVIAQEEQMPDRLRSPTEHRNQLDPRSLGPPASLALTESEMKGAAAEAGGNAIGAIPVPGLGAVATLVLKHKSGQGADAEKAEWLTGMLANSPEMQQKAKVTASDTPAIAATELLTPPAPVAGAARSATRPLPHAPAPREGPAAPWQQAQYRRYQRRVDRREAQRPRAT